jgi:RNA polymerase sigma-70 factor (ECF subfamily)
MMVLLEKLTPSERAVFLLKEVFSYDYTEISEIIEKPEDNCRQIFSRAKKHLGGKEKRFKVDIKIHEKLLHQFLDAVRKGNMEGLFSIFKEDIQLIADNGGKTSTFGRQKFSAARKPVVGKNNVSKFILGITEKVGNNIPNVTNKILYVNGVPSVVTSSNDVPVCLMSLEIVDDKIANVFVQSHKPDSLLCAMGLFGDDPFGHAIFQDAKRKSISKGSVKICKHLPGSLTRLDHIYPYTDQFQAQLWQPGEICRSNSG